MSCNSFDWIKYFSFQILNFKTAHPKKSGQNGVCNVRTEIYQTERLQQHFQTFLNCQFKLIENERSRFQDWAI